MGIIENRIKPECHLWGEKFHPSELTGIQGIVLSGAKEPGEVGSRGRYKGKPTPYGVCEICVPEDIPQPDRILWMADFVRLHKKMFIDVGATEITFWIYWYGVQGNMELSVAELRKIAELGVPLCMDYICLEVEDID